MDKRPLLDGGGTSRLSRLATARVSIQRRATLIAQQAQSRKSLVGIAVAFILVVCLLVGFRLVSPYLKIIPAFVVIPGLGTVEGVVYPVAKVFLGIPFGKAGRFETPVPAGPWSPNILQASEYKPACMHASGFRAEGVSEDCLYLNIFSPTWGVGRNLNPVLVWFHGGGYSLGAGSDTAPEDVQQFVYTHKVVVVTTNYRLGVFGFSGSEHLRAADGSTGNFGLQDQRLALQWVQRHIAPFGGDPTRVSVIGWSAGAASISVHLTAPRSRGLFHHAIMMSGGFTDWAALSLDAAGASYANVADCLGCAVHDRKCVLGRDAQDLLKCGRYQYGPVVDGVEMTVSPFDAIQTGHQAVDYSVPIMIGNALEDALMDIGRHADPAKLRHAAASQLQPYGSKVVDEALRLYPQTIFHNYAAALFPQDWSPSYWAARVLATDRHFTCVSRNVSRQWKRQGRSPAHWYSWLQPQVFTKAQEASLRAKSDSNDPLPNGGFCYPCPGAGHGSDLAFLFDNPSKVDVHGKVMLGDVITDRLQAFYTNFVWSGNTTGNNSDDDISLAPLEAATSELTVPLPVWDSFAESRMNAMQFVAGFSRQLDFYRQEECDFWDAHRDR